MTAYPLTTKSGIVVRFSFPLGEQTARAFTSLSDSSAQMEEGLISWAKDAAAFLAHQTDVLPNMIARPSLVSFKASAGVQTEFGYTENLPCKRMVFLMQNLQAGVRGWGDPSGGLFFAFYRMKPEQWIKFCQVLNVDPTNPEKSQSQAFRVFITIDDDDSFSMFGQGIGF